MKGDFYVTDGTTRISLLDGTDGFTLMDWTPVIPEPKQIFSESMLADGRSLVQSKWANAIETIPLRITRYGMDDIIADMRSLRNLLERARAYFIGGNDTPVWLEARGDCETNIRYAVIADWRAQTEDNPFHKPFALDNPMVDNFVLLLERQHWRDVVPTTTTCVEMKAQQDFVHEESGVFYPDESTDDVHTWFIGMGFINTADVKIILGYDSVIGAPINSGVRFVKVGIPAGSVITKAWLEYESDANSAADNCNIMIEGHDVDDSATFSTYADFVARPRTTAHVHVSALPHWTAGTHYLSPDITTVIQEIVSRGGWVLNNDISIFINDDTSTVNAFRYPVSYDHGGGAHPVSLHVQWINGNTRTYGRAATCTNEVYIANKHNMAQITHVLMDDGGVFSGNLHVGALPYSFLPAVPAVADMVYFGINDAVANSGPFMSLVFDLSAIDPSDTKIWEYWSGAAWSALTVKDNTNADGAMTGNVFDTMGVNSVHWQPPSNWAVTAVNGISGWWVRVRVTALGGFPNTVTQQNRHIYTIVTPYLETTAAQVPGDIRALARLQLEGQSGNTDALTPHLAYIMAGLRSMSKGTNFTSYINLADEQNQPDITITVNAGSAVFASGPEAPSGRYVSFTTAGAAGTAYLVYATLSQAITDDFRGIFRILMRFTDASAGAGRGTYTLKICHTEYQNPVVKSLAITPSALSTFGVIDFGIFNFPAFNIDLGQTVGNSFLRIDGAATAAVSVKLYDLILMPVDECFYEGQALPQIDTLAFTSNVPRLGYYNSSRKSLNADSTIPRRRIKSEVVNDALPVLTMANWEDRLKENLIMQPNEAQKWWFFTALDDKTSYKPFNALSGQAWKVSRYLGSRGNS